MLTEGEKMVWAAVYAKETHLGIAIAIAKATNEVKLLREERESFTRAVNKQQKGTMRPVLDAVIAESLEMLEEMMAPELKVMQVQRVEETPHQLLELTKGKGSE